MRILDTDITWSELFGLVVEGLIGVAVLYAVTVSMIVIASAVGR